jgi:cytochrome P450
MLSEILNNDGLRLKIYEEVQPYVSPAGRSTLTTNEIASRLQNCQTLTAVYHEALRVSSSSTSIRIVMEDARVGHFHLRKGERIVIPHRQLLFNENIFGDDVHEFNHERFIRMPGLAKSPHYRPFGSGASLCPGRAIAHKEVITFVAIAIGKFQCRTAASDKRMPKMDTETPSIGIMGPEKGEDITMAITRPQW